MLTESITELAYTATGLVADVQYSFKILARNAVGFSPESVPLTILAAEVSTTPSAPTTTINGNYVDLTWLEPSDGGSPILSYTILIR